MFDSDFLEDVYLPSPNQLKYKILIKNKKLQPRQSSKQRVCCDPVKLCTAEQ